MLKTLLSSHFISNALLLLLFLYFIFLSFTREAEILVISITLFSLISFCFIVNLNFYKVVDYIWFRRLFVITNLLLIGFALFGLIRSGIKTTTLISSGILILIALQSFVLLKVFNPIVKKEKTWLEYND